jgi:hypothetical protein
MSVKDAFSYLTIEEAARINFHFRHNGLAFTEWDEYQWVFEKEYKPAREMLWADRENPFVNDKAAFDAYAAFCVTADKTGMIYYPDMSKQEATCFTLARYLITIMNQGDSIGQAPYLRWLTKQEKTQADKDKTQRLWG